MTSVQFDLLRKQEINEAFDRFLWQARLLLIFPAAVLAFVLLRSLLRHLLRRVYRDFVLLSKEFAEVLSSTTDATLYASTFEKRTAFAKKLEEVVVSLDRIRPIELRNHLFSPLRVAEFRSFIFHVQREAKSHDKVRAAADHYASVREAIPIPPERREWTPEKGNEQLRALNDILPFIASSITTEMKASD